jgi:NADH-quinone oxidoreductase subunit M
MQNILTLMTFIPLLGVLALQFVPKGKDQIVKWIAVGFTAIPLLLSFQLINAFNFDTAAMQFVEKGSWISSLNVEYHMGVDGLSILMVLLTSMLSFLGVFASWNVKKMVKGYFTMYLLLHVGMMGVFCALDFFLFYVFYEIMLLPMYFLVGIWGGEKKEYAAIKFFLYTLAGSVFLLIGIIGLYMYSRGPDGSGIPTFNILQLATMDWTQYTINIFGVQLPFDKTVWWLMFVGFAVKVPIVPLHTWLPWAHVQAPTAVSVILAGVLLKIGTYGMLRMNWTILPEATQSLSYVLVIMGIVNIIYGALCAMAQKDLKKLVAYSSVSHMGYCILGMAAAIKAGAGPSAQAAMNGAVLQMFNHGLSSAMMFMLVGVLYDRLHHRYIVTEDGRLGFGGIAQKAPWVTAAWTVAIFASLGLPGLNGFVSEALVFLGVFPIYKTATVIASLGIVLTGAYLLWMAQRVFLGPFTTLEKDTRTGSLVAAHEIAEPTVREWVVVAPLAILCLVVGVYPQPFLNFVKVSLNQLLSLYN